MNDKHHDSQPNASRISRRHMLQGAAGLAGLGAAGLTGSAAADKQEGAEKAVTKGRVKQSVVHWCFAEHWNTKKMAHIAKKLGCQSIELAPPEDWPILKQHGLVCAIAGIDMSPDPPFVKGYNNPEYHERIIHETKKSIDACAEYDFPSVIAFTGYKEDISPEDGIKNCIAGLKKVIGYAEKRNVNICLEILNTRDDTDPMKGHPGYQGDHVDYCMEIVKGVGSPNMKLLFDIYHVQIMDGDLIRRIREVKDHIGHVHTAGNPGRGELDDTQEINYPPVIKALMETGYDGYVGQEFIPTRDPLAGLTQAVRLCDV